MKNTVKVQLNNGLLKYKDLIKPLGIESKMNDEKFVYYKNNVMDDKVVVRSSIARLLASANVILKTSYGYSIKVLCGYRSLEEQTKRFNELYEKTKLKNPNMNEEDLLEEAHKFIAVPTVAGHPTGGAVDVTLVDIKTGLVLDMGSKYCDFDDVNVYAKSPYVSEQVKRNREILRKTMLSVGFAPFDGEWWHYSYGDREWAIYRGQSKYFYNQIELKKSNDMIYEEEIFSYLSR